MSSQVSHKQSTTQCLPVPLFPDISERDLRAIAWNACGVLRNGPELSAAGKRLQTRALEQCAAPNRACFELRNMHQVAYLISVAALAREESRGGHYRTDFPRKSIAFEKHSIIMRASCNAFEAQVAFA
jgi:L-aspartate oxidase